MSFRKIGLLLCASVIVLAAAAMSAEATDYNEKQVALKKDGRAKGTTRMGGGGGKGTTLRATTVKSSKSNSSDRMGGGGGKGASVSPRKAKSDPFDGVKVRR